ncbi:hypothetical protein N6H14_14840 [Paenibacillus sp. CC-CFT747]|nr:hypothetical protein N6H14_14840 [Paenibacillus sp. CC-CFT747]
MKEIVYVSAFTGLTYGAGRDKVVAITFKDFKNEPVKFEKEYYKDHGAFHIGDEEIDTLRRTDPSFPQRQGRTFTDWGHHVEEYLSTLMMREEGLFLEGRAAIFKWQGPLGKDHAAEGTSFPFQIQYSYS